jgi:hypothetical protein
MTDSKKLNPNWKKRISEIGKQPFELEEMLKLGFIKPETDKDKKIVDKAQKKFNEDIELLNTKEKEINIIKEEIQEAQNTEKLLAEIKQKRIKRSKRIRAERKATKDSNTIERQLADKQRRLITPPFLGKRVSGKLNYNDGNVRQLKKSKLPIINNMQDLANYLTIDMGKISWLVYHREVTNVDHYNRFRIPKRSGSERIISAPKTYLKNAQSWINTEILEKIKPEKEATAFRKNKNILDNALPHSNQGTVIRVDLADFFSTITFPRTRGLFSSLGYNSGVSSVLALLCTDSDRRQVVYQSENWYVSQGPRKLPQGATTSPALSNLVARNLDRRIRGYLNYLEDDWVYTRYADDLVFSHPDKNVFVGRLLTYLDRVIRDEGFKINKKKTVIMRTPHRQMITGLVLNENGVRVPKKYLKKVRAMVHNADQLMSKGGSPDNIDEIKGRLSFIKMVMPEYAKKTHKKYPWLKST